MWPITWGDRIEVKVASVNLDDKKIDLTLSDFTPKKRRPSRSGKDNKQGHKPNKRSSGAKNSGANKDKSKAGTKRSTGSKSRGGKNNRNKKEQ